MSKLFKPTESELEILSILWEKGNATVREVHEVVQKTTSYLEQFIQLVSSLLCE